MANATPESLLDFEWLGRWRPLAVPDRSQFEEELYRELAPGHPLQGLQVTTLGRKYGYDDFLFLVYSDPPQLAFVHLTWQKETTPKWPYVELFGSAEEWVEGYMRPDAEGWPDDAGEDEPGDGPA